jgi:hypothetical protein
VTAAWEKGRRMGAAKVTSSFLTTVTAQASTGACKLVEINACACSSGYPRVALAT